MKSKLFISLFCLFGYSALFAQDPADISYRTIAMDSIDQLSLSVYPGDSVAIKAWPGNHLMIETSVMLYNGRQNILEFLKEQGRWDFTDQKNGKVLTLVSKDQERRVVKGKDGSTEDKVEIVIYVPEDFEPAGSQMEWRRKKER